jgi:hypothetical protein
MSALGRQAVPGSINRKSYWNMLTSQPYLNTAFTRDTASRLTIITQYMDRTVREAIEVEPQPNNINRRMVSSGLLRRVALVRT